jgi:pyruvate dehydrogenase (quinone)
VRHEEAAAFMACAYAKFTGRLGVCLATSGPGGIHLLNGLYDAKLDGAPVLAITGLQFHDLVGTHTQQDVELDKLFMDVAVYNARIMGGACRERGLARLPHRLGARGVAHITMPVDMQSQPVESPAAPAQRPRAHLRPDGRRLLPSEDQLGRAAAILNAGKVCIPGRPGRDRRRRRGRKRWPNASARRSASRCSARRAARRQPLSVGGVGLLGTKPSQEALENCDTLLIVGSSFPYIEFYPKPGQARAVQIDLDATRIGLRYPVEAGLVGDSAKVISRRCCRGSSTRRTARSSTSGAGRHGRTGAKLMHERGTRTDMPMKPQVVAHELNKLLRDDAIVTTDSGTITTWVARTSTCAAT